MYAVNLANAFTGELGTDVTHLLAGGSADDELTTLGTGTVILQGDAEVEPGQATGKEIYAEIVTNWSMLVATTRDDTTGVIQAVEFVGLVISNDFDDDSGQITIYAESLRTLMATRLTFGVANFVDGDFKLTSQSIQAAVAAILTRATAWGGNWGLPLDLPTGGTGRFSTDVLRSDITSIEDLLVQVEKSGAEIRFEPYITGTTVRHRVKVARRLTGTETVLALMAERTPIRSYKEKKDGSRQVSGTFVTGNGQGSQRPYAWAGFAAGPPMVVRDAWRSASDITSQTVLQDYADSDLAADRAPRTLVSFDIVPSTEFPASWFVPSSLLTIDITGHRVLPDSRRTFRVLGMHHDFASSIRTPRIELLNA